MNEEFELYNENGYVVIRNYLSALEVNRANKEMEQALNGERNEIKGLIPEECLSIVDLAKKYMSCHIVHNVSDHFMSLMKHKNAKLTVSKLIGPNVKCMHSNYFLKYSGAESSKGHGWHQDEFFIPTRDRSLTSIWIALDNVTIKRGCLKVIPGSHKSGILWPMGEHNNPSLDRALESNRFPYSENDCRYLELNAGDAVAFNGYLLHGSGQNIIPDTFRRALVYFYMSAESLLPWDHTGQRESTEDCRDIYMVIGSDPYSYKGLSNVSTPYVRKIGPSESDIIHAKKQKI